MDRKLVTSEGDNVAKASGIYAAIIEKMFFSK